MLEFDGMKLTIETEQETDGRWLAEVLELPGVMAYGGTPEDARKNAIAVALRTLADEIEHGDRAAIGPIEWVAA